MFNSMFVESKEGKCFKGLNAYLDLKQISAMEYFCE